MPKTPSFRVNVKATHRGQIFNAAATNAQARRMIIAINDAIAVEGVNRVKARLRQVLQNPTGFYESNIQVERREVYRGVTDGGVIYGPWLEGTGSRNKTTRFKGYKTFRTVKQGLDADAEMLAQPYVDDFVRGMDS